MLCKQNTPKKKGERDETIAQRNHKNPQDILKLVTDTIDHFHPTKIATLNIQWLAQEAKIPKSTLYRRIQENDLKISELKKIAKALNQKPETLLTQLM